MIPYDSFLIDPFLLFGFAVLFVWLTKRLAAPIRFRRLLWLGILTLAVFWITSISLYFDLEWTRWIWEMCRAESGRDWMINSGVFHFEFRNPAWTTHALSACCFVTYPIWYMLGVVWALRRWPWNDDVMAKRWQGEKGRLDAWYATWTDKATGDGYWLHGEILASQSRPAEVLGWFAHFPKAATPQLTRFGPVPAATITNAMSEGLSVPGLNITRQRFSGTAGDTQWDVAVQSELPTLFCLPRWSWLGALLPASHAVPLPQCRLEGKIRLADRDIALSSSAGALGRIYGRGHAQAWSWLHADLGDDGILEVVAARSRLAPFCYLGTPVFLAFSSPRLGCPKPKIMESLKCFTVRMNEYSWTIEGEWRSHRIRIAVTIPPASSLLMTYQEPDDSECFCRNSEIASAEIILERYAGQWQEIGHWHLDGVAHAEVGYRSLADLHH